VLVVQGERDRFGGAEQVNEALTSTDPVRGDIRLLGVAGADHGLKKPLDLATIRDWILQRLSSGR
jgi:predicted alpha/beta-hydrolase family hydrolase